MTKLLIFFSLLLLAASPISTNAANPPSLAEKFVGRILLQVESDGQAWYVNPKDLKRYYLKDGDEAYAMMRALSLGITNADLAKISTTAIGSSDPKIMKRLKGRLLLQVEDKGQVWYLNIMDWKIRTVKRD